MTNPTPRLLVVRRENIGDLVCATPLIAALRIRFPGAVLDCLVNSYSAAVLHHHPHVDGIHSYVKPRHQGSYQSRLSAGLVRARALWALRQRRYDYAILATADFLEKDIRLLRAVGAKHIVALSRGENPLHHVDIRVSYPTPAPRHIVEQLGALARPFGYLGEMPGLLVVPAPDRVAALTAQCQHLWGADSAPIGVHISSRSEQQRWPAEHFVRFLRQAHERFGFHFLLFWSPGQSDNKFHPGDDEKARAILQATQGLPIVGQPTAQLEELIAGLSVCRAVVCSDGGAMHVAAGLGKPILCFFGTADPQRWHPWRVPYELLRPESRNVTDLTVDQALAAFETLARRCGLDEPQSIGARR